MKDAEVIALTFVIVIVQATIICIIIFNQPKLATDISGVGAGYYSSPEVDAWLKDNSSKLVSMESWYMFPDDLAEDVLWTVDIEYFETADDFMHKPSSDWVALVYITRLGQVIPWFGEAENDYQAPLTQFNPETVHIIDIGSALQSNTWHRIHVIADFATRKFVSFNVYEPGSGLNITLDLSSYDLWENPLGSNFADGRLLAYYIGAFKAPLFLNGSNVVYADDIIGKIYRPNKGWITVLDDGFELQSEIIPLKNMEDKEWWLRTAWEEGKWYQERDTAVIGLTSSTYRSPNYSCYLDASPFEV